MVETVPRNGVSKHPTLDALNAALTDALGLGVTPRDILTMLSTAVAEQETEQGPLPGFPGDGQDFVYDELPDGYIDIPTAANKYNVPRPNLHAWLYRGRLRSYGRLRGSSPGGGSHIVYEADLKAELEKPVRKGGRRPKGPEPLTVHCPNCGAVSTVD